MLLVVSSLLVAVLGEAAAQTVEPCPLKGGGLAIGTQLQCSCSEAVTAGTGRGPRGQRQGTPADGDYPAFGTDRYAGLSEICRAARHAGALRPAGGVIRVTVAEGCKEYRPTLRNGILTGEAAATATSFGFGDNLPACPSGTVAAAPPPVVAKPAPPPAPAAPPPVAPAPAAPPADTGGALKRLADLGVKAGGQPPTPENVAQIQNVYVSGDNAKKFTDEDCAALPALPRLGSLSLQGVAFSAACAGSLARIKTLMQLSLDGSTVPDASLAPLAETGLRSLSLSLVKEMTDAGLAHVGKIASLQRLNLERAPVGDAGIAHLASMPALEWLSVAQTTVSTAGMAHIAKMPALVELAARSLSMPDDALAALATGAKKLRRLQVSHSKTLTPASVAHIARLAELRQLELWNGRFGGGLAPLAALTKLEELITSGSGITDADLVEVARIVSLRNYVSYGDQGITDKGLAALGAMPNLQNLVLGKTRITDAGLPALKGMPALRQFGAPETAISDAGIAAIAALKLQSVDLRATSVTDAGLAGLLKMESVTSINVMQTKVTDDGVKAAKAARPTVYVAR